MSKLKIRDVVRKENSNIYCGASALSVITGLDSSICARILADFNSDVMIKGCSIPRMINAIRNYGLEAKIVLNIPDKLGTFIKQRKVGDKNFYLIVARTHYQIIQGNRYVCGQAGKVASIYKNKYCEWGADLERVYIISGDVKMPKNIKEQINKWQNKNKNKDKNDFIKDERAVKRLLKKTNMIFQDLFEYGMNDDRGWWYEEYKENNETLILAVNDDIKPAEKWNNLLGKYLAQEPYAEEEEYQYGYIEVKDIVPFTKEFLEIIK